MGLFTSKPKRDHIDQQLDMIEINIQLRSIKLTDKQINALIKALKLAHERPQHTIALDIAGHYVNIDKKGIKYHLNGDQ